MRRRFLEVDVTILDDFGAEMDGGATSAAACDMDRLLGERVNTGRPRIITMNLVSAQDRGRPR